MDLKINPVIKKKIPPLTEEEYADLKSRIATNGFDASEGTIIVWDEENTIVDGHHRWRVCQELGVEPVVTRRHYGSIDDVLLDAIERARAQRNLTLAWKVQLRDESRLILEAKGREKYEATVGRPSKEKSLSTIDNDFDVDVPDVPDVPDDPKHDTRSEVAKQAGVSTGTIAMSDVIRKEDPDAWQKCLDGEETIGGAYKHVKRKAKQDEAQQKRQANQQKIALIKKPDDILKTGTRFTTVVVDPPWDWGDEGDISQFGRAKPTYATMSKDDLLNLPVKDLVDTNSHIYLWITNRSLPKGFALLDAWGFRYITMITWVKPSFGMGNYFRGQTEHVMFGVRGSLMLKRKDAPTVFHAPRGPNGHSSKPVDFYDFVETCSYGPYLEMFSRANRDGWVMWGEKYV